MSYKITGKITHVIDKSGVSKKSNAPFVSFRYGILETEGQFPNSAVIDVFGDKLPKLNVGDLVEIDFNCKISEYQGNIYHQNSAWKINVISEPEKAKEEKGDLPF